MLIILCYLEVIPSNYKLDLGCKAGFFPKNKKGKNILVAFETLHHMKNQNKKKGVSWPGSLT